MLRRELRRQVRLDPTLSFLDARKEALRWVEEGENPCVQRPRAVSGSPLPPAPSIPRVGVRSQQYRYHPDVPPGSTAHVPGGESLGNSSVDELRLLGKYPTVEITIGGVTVACLLDTGSMVTTITQQFYKQYLQPQLQFQLQPCQWLKLKAANGLDIPYLGYLEMTIGILGKTLPKMGILVVKNSSDFATQSRREQVPGLLGMNIISSCYQELFLEHGARLFEDASSQHAGKVWQRAFSECQLWERALETGYVGPARVQKGPAVRVPAGTLKLVPATCHQGLGATFSTCFLEPVSFVDGRLLGDLLVPSACLAVTSGMVKVPVVNVGSQDRWLWPKIILGELHIVQSPVLKSSVQFHVQNDDSEEVALIQSVEVESNPNVDFSHLTWPMLSCSERQQAQALLEKYANVFSHGDGDLGCTDLLQHTITLLDDAPLRQRYRRLPPSQYDLVKTHIQELVEQGIVKPSCSPYASSIVVVQKKDGSIRLCVDYRQLNAKTRKDAFPLPRIEETLDALSGAKLFSTLDLASGYNQVSVAPQDREKTAFYTPFGLFEFNRMPFGLCNAPSTFQRLMERIFGDQSLHALLLYLDDIVIFSSTFDQHLERLEMVLSRLQTHNLKVKLKKCNFFQTEVGYLGHVISAAGVATDPEKIRAVAEWSRPNSVRELRSFLGFASYYRWFVEGFAGLVAPLHKLVGVLQEADASNLGLGAVLSQEQGGLRRPIAFASRGLRPSERNMTNYSSMKLELLALKWAMTEKFREYLLGNKVTVYADNNPLRYLESAKLGAVEQRWVSQLTLFEYEIKYRPGTANHNADALSRLPLHSVDHSINVPPGIAVPLSISTQERPPGLSPQVAEASMVDAVPARNRANLKALQAADPCIKVFLQFWVQGQPPTVAELKEMPREVQQLVKQWPRVREMDGILYRLVQIPPSRELVWQLLLPKKLQGEVLTNLHDNHGHQGVECTTALIRQRCYWPNMWQDIKKWW
ncbi:Retrovirus-related Pol polyprotein from transposon 17.6 [Labeo rohita]|uniref:Gypsy retrotransposon integrase-like protein 1 n=1 Tax=Labeo rohita TaxID=84645 RepID=A0ABQ8LWU7_LABRO|nr:Retrovirus-related Pol polyprotein from transposon 17.6 [Labeo rohita]